MPSTEIEKVTGFALNVEPPKQVRNLLEAEHAIEWLRAKRKFDEAVSEFLEEAKKAANVAHKALTQLERKTKYASDQAADELRTRVEAYAEDERHELPKGVSRRKAYRVTITDKYKIPAEYLKPDEDLILHVIKKTDGAAKIPGVEWDSETLVTIREE